MLALRDRVRAGVDDGAATDGCGRHTSMPPNLTTSSTPPNQSVESRLPLTPRKLVCRQNARPSGELSLAKIPRQGVPIGQREPRSRPSCGRPPARTATPRRRPPKPDPMIIPSHVRVRGRVGERAEDRPRTASGTSARGTDSSRRRRPVQRWRVRPGPPAPMAPAALRNVRRFTGESRSRPVQGRLGARGKPHANARQCAEASGL